MLDRLMRRLPDAGEDKREVLSEILEDAGRAICAFTCRDEVPEELKGAQVQLAAVMYNRMGMEGESSHDEGGIVRRADMMPEDIACLLRPWRLIRAVRA